MEIAPGPGPPAGRNAGEVVLCGALAAAMAALMVLAVPRGGDLAAHLYRTTLVQHGILVWDNLWFSGQYPLSSYSLLYYLLAAVVGNATLGIAGVVIAAAIFASIALTEWKTAGRWPARAFAVLLAGQAFTAAYPYDLGLASLLATLWALQRKHLGIAACCTFLTLGLSPLAFVFLVLALVAIFLRRRRVGRQVVVIAAAVVMAAGLELGVLVLLPSPGIVYPYGIWRLLVGLGVTALGTAVALRGRGGRQLASIFVIWAAASVITDLVQSPVGHNLVRADVFLFPLVLVAAALADFRPRALVAAALLAAFAATVVPYLTMIPVRSSTVAGTPAYWKPIIQFLRARRSQVFRVEVVPTANHWEAYYLPRAGIALARGWYRQLDIADDAALYAPTLTPASYRAWLRAHAVRFVVVPDVPLEAVDAPREARLLRSGRSGLVLVHRTRNAAVYELPHPTGLLTGPGRAAITTLQSSRISGYVDRAGTYFLRVRYSPYWSVTHGALCVAAGRSAMTRLDASRPGGFTIRAAETPGGLLAALVDHDRGRCGLPR